LLNEFAVGGCAQGNGVVMLAGTPDDDEPGQDVARQPGHVRSVAAVLGWLGYPVKEVRWTARRQ